MTHPPSPPTADRNGSTFPTPPYAATEAFRQGEPEPRLELARLAYEPLATRPSKVTLDQLGRVWTPGSSEEAAGFLRWMESMPEILAGNSLRRLTRRIVDTRRAGRRVMAALGGHVIKTGCAPYLIDWLRRGILTGVAMNGAAAIHDLELAVGGHTSEDVTARLHQGTFGFAEETSAMFAAACDRASASGIGLGAALGAMIAERGGPGLDASLLVAAYRCDRPATVHAAIGTDIVHMTPLLDGAALGRATLEDFRILCDRVACLEDGIWINIGSAVVLPEVFLKAVAVIRNLNYPLDRLTTANLDFQQQYRGMINVLQRPGAEGIGLTGHHELLIPLLHAAVTCTLRRDADAGVGE